MREVTFVRSADKLALATNATGHLAQSSSASRVTAPHKPGAPASRASLPMHRPYSAGNGHFLDGRFERHTASTRIVLVTAGRPAVEHDRRPGRLWQAPARRFDSGGSAQLSAALAAASAGATLAMA